MRAHPWNPGEVVLGACPCVHALSATLRKLPLLGADHSSFVFVPPAQISCAVWFLICISCVSCVGPFQHRPLSLSHSLALSFPAASPHSGSESADSAEDEASRGNGFHHVRSSALARQESETESHDEDAEIGEATSLCPISFDAWQRLSIRRRCCSEPQMALLKQRPVQELRGTAGSLLQHGRCPHRQQSVRTSHRPRSKCCKRERGQTERVNRG